jgi:CO/xanthine dehydrogenase Mo-binding subunit
MKLGVATPGRPVQYQLTRRQTFALVGYRTPTIQRVQLGAQRDGTLTAIAHDVVEQTSTIEELAEQTAVAMRMMYAAPNHRTTHRLARLDLPTIRRYLHDPHVNPMGAKGIGEVGIVATTAAIAELSRTRTYLRGDTSAHDAARDIISFLTLAG